MRVHLVNPSHVSFGVGVITPRWLYVIAAATPLEFGDPVIVDETLNPIDISTIGAGDIVGVGIHTGLTWYGAVGQGDRTELTAVGDAMNTTARLASAAQAGEILVTTAAAAAAGLDSTLERRSLELKGKQLPTEVVSIRVGSPVADHVA